MVCRSVRYEDLPTSMKKKKVNIKSLVDEFKSETDKMGSYTGVPSDEFGEHPVQDADDL